MSQYLVNIIELLPSLPEFSFCKNEELDFIACNEAFAVATGFDTIKKTIDKNDLDVTAFKMQDNFSEVMNADRQIITCGEPILGIEEIHNYPNNKKQLIITNKYPLLNNHGEVTGIFGIYSQLKNTAAHSHLSLIDDLVHASLINNNKVKHYQLETDRGSRKITAREFDCIKELLQGKMMKEIARALNITEYTVKSHLNNIKQKLDCSFKSELINYILKKTNFFELMSKIDYIA